MNWQPKHPAIRQLISALRAETNELYLVGGAVRDLLLGSDTPIKDIDIVVAEPALAIARRVANRLGWAYFALDETREIARILFNDGQHAPYICDIARLRGDTIQADLLARDFTINALALVWTTSGQTEVIDICGGVADLRAGLVRRVSPVSLADDAIRLLRAPRFVAQLNFRLDAETEAQIVRLARTLQLASPERIRDELWKTLTTARPVLALQELHRLGLLPHVLPELSATLGVAQTAPHHEDVFHHTLRTVENAAHLRTWLLAAPSRIQATASICEHATGMDTPWLGAALSKWRFRLRQLFTESVTSDHTRADWLVWYALLHDIGKPATQEHVAPGIDAGPPASTVPRIRFLGHEEVGAELTQARLNHLRFSRNETALATHTVAGHMRPHLLHTAFDNAAVSRRACFRFFRDVTIKAACQMAGFDILLLALCDHVAIFRTSQPEFSAAYYRRIEELLAFGFEQIDQAGKQHAPLVDGRMIMRHFNLKPGPHIGALLAEIQEAQVAGEVATVEAALALAHATLAQRISAPSGTVGISDDSAADVPADISDVSQKSRGA